MIDDIIKYLEETEKLEEAAKLERAVSDRMTIKVIVSKNVIR